MTENPFDEIPAPEVEETEEAPKNWALAPDLDPRREELPRTAPYLDEVQRREAEKQRALIEGREPDYENPGSIQGTQVVLPGQD